ncbi:hypothetical protein Goari_006262 [Gossypium aridum]|uniref:DUF4283 domain-containing protein n=1 Tax=Gossypium aridum TaxID=34290 RepID=A0A7J8XMJ8_GOSAI|nr:hypothetical protein [Gossypium aridum]
MQSEHESNNEGDCVSRSTKKVRIQEVEIESDMVMQPAPITGKPRIGNLALHNKVCALWKPSQPFLLMDVEKGYFLAKLDFSIAQPYPSMVMAWIQLLGLHGHMYNRKVLWEIWGTIGKVAKLDFNTDKEPMIDASNYGPWMLVERKCRQPPRMVKGNGGETSGPFHASKFQVLETLADEEGDWDKD